MEIMTVNIIDLIQKVKKIQELIKENKTYEAVNFALKTIDDAESIGCNKIALHINDLISEYNAKNFIDNKFLIKEKNFQSSIGVHIHAYYIDVCSELIEAVSNISIEKHVYISTPKEEDIDKIRLLLKKFKIDEVDSTIVLTPNRGRNFGPMLVEFGKKLLCHDIILHLHTKKSLRTGEEQVVWRQHSWRSLCGTKEHAEKIIKAFSDNTELGVVGPFPLEQYSSYWWKCWLSVGHLLPSFFEKLKITKYPKKGFIQFPIGSMFWARSDAISPLLEFNWSYEDFPDEPFPDDGTIAHVIERAIGCIAEHKGYKYLESKNSESNNFDLVHPQKIADDYFNFVDYLNTTPRESIVSFDFFDTLFTRSVLCPDDIYGYIGCHLKYRKNIYNGSRFYAYRKKSEALARNIKSSGEVNIDEIYKSFVEVSNWNKDIIDYAKLMELTIESKLLTPRWDVIAFARRAKENGSRLIIISDTYLPFNFLHTILAKWGLDDLFDEVYTSCEVLARKDWGTIWPYVAEKENLTYWSEEFIHIGDNEQSDIQQPIRNGMRALGVLNPSVMYNLTGAAMPSDWLYGQSNWSEGMILGPVVSKICNSPIPKKRKLSLEYDTSNNFGYCVVGPMLFGFVAWLIKKVREDAEISNLAFVARDGWYLKTAYDLVANFLPKGYVPPSVYLMTSRQALLAATDPSDLDYYVNLLVGCGDYFGDLNQFFKERISLDFGFSDESLRVKNKDGIDASKVLKFLKNNYSKLYDHSSKNKIGLKKHLESINFNISGFTPLVDLGYAGTIQSLLQDSIKSPITGYYFALNNKATKVSKNYQGRAYGCFGDSRDLNKPISLIEAYSLYLEAVFTAPHQKVTGYFENGNAIYSDRIDPNIKFSSDVMGGAFDYISEIISVFGLDAIEAKIDSSVCLSTFEDFVKGRVSISSKMKKDFLIDDYFCGNGLINPFEIYNHN